MHFSRWMKWAVLVAVVAAAAASAQEAMTTANAMTRLTKKLSPTYPVAAKQLNVTGQQEVTIVVDEAGNVVDAKVVKGNALFTQSSLAAVKEWKFTPLVKDGQAVKFSTIVVFNYQK